MADKVYDQLCEELQTVTRKMGWWATNKSKLELLIAKFEALDMDVRVSMPGIDVNGNGDKAKLLKIFKLMRAHDYVPNARPKSGESYFATYWHREVDDVPVWINFGSTVCRRVQVGTELKEVPVYEIQCSNDEMTVTDEEVDNA